MTIFDKVKNDIDNKVRKERSKSEMSKVTPKAQKTKGRKVTPEAAK